MRVNLEVGVVQELCYLLDREIDTMRESRDILSALPPERKVASGSHCYGEYVKWCEEDLAAYTVIRESLEKAMHNSRFGRPGKV